MSSDEVSSLRSGIAGGEHRLPKITSRPRLHGVQLYCVRPRSSQTAWSISVLPIRWRIAFPALMAVPSTLLMIRSATEEPMLREMGTGFEVPATIINSVINGPGYYLSALLRLPIPDWLNEHLRYEACRLPAIIAFWFLAGLATDRHKAGKILGGQHSIPVGIPFMFAAFCCAVFGIGLGVVEFRNAVSWWVLAEYPLRSASSMALGFVVWLLAFSCYFLRRTLIAARQSVRPNSGTAFRTGI